MPEVDGGRFKAGTRNIRSWRNETSVPGIGVSQESMLAGTRKHPIPAIGRTSHCQAHFIANAAGTMTAAMTTATFPPTASFRAILPPHPANAAIGAAGIIGSTPWRSATPYPSQVVIKAARGQAYCGQRNRSYNRASGAFPGKDGARHRC